MKEKSRIIKKGNTSFREESIRNMSLKDFKSTYEKKARGVDLEALHKEVTGKNAS